MAPTKESVKTSQENDKGDEDGGYSLAQSRSRRQKIDKKGRQSAFEKLRKAKEQGAKNKYEVEEEANVYDVVEEGEYSELVKQRQEDDWIIDDDGAGYVEDGREIFDDDIEDEAPSNAASKRKKDDKKRNRNIVRPGTKPKQDIKSMFAAAAASSKRRPEKEISLADDDILDDLMGELSKSSAPAAGSTLGKVPQKHVKKLAYNPFKVENKPSPPSAFGHPSRAIKREPVKTDRELFTSSETSATSSISTEAEWTKMKARTVEADEAMDESDSIPPVCVEQIKEEMEDPADQSAVDLCGIDFDEEVEEDGQKPATPVADPKTAEQKDLPKKKLISDELLSLGWENIAVSSDQSDTLTEVQIDTSHLPLVTNSAGEQVLRFYWLDAYEDSYNQPGVVYLFGKVYVEKADSYASCCVTVKNIERRIYLLPRVKRVNLKTDQELSEDVTMPMVYEEFDQIAEKHRILKFKSMKVQKSYAFEKLEVPVEADYLEVRYAADLPGLPMNLKGETFSHVFGSNTSSLELLLIGRKMKGPAWLDLRCPQIPSPATSWCKLEVTLSKPEHISLTESSLNLAPPPLVVMTLSMQTLPNLKTRQNEIVSVACLVHTDFHMDRSAPKPEFQQHFCVITKPSDCIFPYDFRDQVKKQAGRMKVEIMPTERGLVGVLLARIQKLDPDLLVGHDIYGFDLDLLLHRISANKVPHWSRISRLKRSVMPKLAHSQGRATFAEKSAVCGRMMCDVQISARELIRCRSYDLSELTNQILKEKRVEIDYEQIRAMFMTSEKLLKLVELSLVDSRYILRIMYELNAIPLALQITNICGNVMSRTLMGGRSERNEWLLLHAFQEKQYICPDKEFKKKQPVVMMEGEEDVDQNSSKKTGQSKRKPAYTGGLVLEPKKGFYDTFILLLDFNSLYPSIIQEYNICFTTISRSEPAAKVAEEESFDETANLILPDPSLEAGVLPTEIRKLVDSRKQVKSLMKGSDVSAEQMMQYDIRQKALKLTANSMYGCLGFSFSRFYAKPLAALVTGKGREILLKTKDLVQNLNLDVIYGDTDSIMINTNCRDLDQVFKLGNKVKAEVNKLYRLLEIDIDGVFESMLLLKKKKYAALSISRSADGKTTRTKELKGLDIVRRDWCDLAKDVGRFVVDQILSGESKEKIIDSIHGRLQEVREEIQAGKIPVKDFHITKQLTKNPEDYPDKKSLPHVQVAMRFNSKGGKKMKAGDTVPYIVCEDGSTMSATQRAYHHEELAKQDNLTIDTKYYLAHQIHPVVSRLCDPIDGTDSAHIAQCLGLDPSSYRQSMRQNEEEEEEDLVTMQLTMEERFRDCARFTFPCPSPTCGTQIVMDSAFTGRDSAMCPTLLACSNTDCKRPLWQSKAQLKNLLQLKIQEHVNKYYQGWLKCEDTTCGTRTNKLPLILQRGHPVCPACGRGYLRPEFSSSALYAQLCFYEYIFDVHNASIFMTDAEKVQAGRMNSDVAETYRELKLVVNRWLDASAYSNVDLGKLFQGLGICQLTKIKAEREI